jgi:hypothetical protein
MLSCRFYTPNYKPSRAEDGGMGGASHPRPMPMKDSEIVSPAAPNVYQVAAQSGYQKLGYGHERMRVQQSGILQRRAPERIPS